MSLDQQQIVIPNLDTSVLHFTSSFLDNEPLVNLRDAGIVKPEYEPLSDKYYKKEMEIGDPDNEYACLVRKQEYRRFKSDKPVSIIRRKEITNALGCDDDYYYYIIYRSKWLNSWYKSFRLDKYKRKEGIYIPFNILKHIDRNKLEQISEVVLVMGDSSIFYSKSTDVLNFFRKNKMPLVVNSYGLMQTCLPKEIFKEKWKK